MKNAKLLLLQKFGEIIIDGLLVLSAFLLSYFLRIGQWHSSDFPFWPYFSLVLTVTPLFIFLLAWSGLYSLREKNSGELFRIVSLSSLSGVTLFVLIFFFQREFFFSRLIVLFVFIFSTFFLFLFHFFLLQYRSHQHKKGINTLRTLIIGNGRAAESVIERIVAKGTRFQPVGILAPYGGGKKEVNGIPVLGKLDALERVVEEENIDALFQTEAGEQTINLLLFSEGKFLEFHMCPAIFGAFRNTLVSEKIAGLPFLGQSLSPLFGWGQVGKRLTDILVSGVVLIVCSPFFLFKKINGKEMATGPKRNVFNKYEFQNAHGFFKFMPEFINVLYGEMSLVGPRPRSDSERENLKLHERRRLTVKPGIFGLWQIERLHGAPDDIQKAIELDTKYIFNWSYMGDILILVKSVVLLFSSKK